MANTAGPRAPPPQDEDEITFLPPIELSPVRPLFPRQTSEVVPNDASATNRSDHPTTEHTWGRPGLPRQTAEVVAKDVSVPTPDPPITPPPSPPRPPAAGFQFVNFDGVHEAALPGAKRSWKRIQVYARFWKYRSTRQPAPELETDESANNSRRNGFWKRVRRYFSKSAPRTRDYASRETNDDHVNNETTDDPVNDETTDDPVDNATVEPTKPNAPENPLDADNSNENFDVRVRRARTEVHGFLQTHRRKFTSGHEGRLRARPDPTNPATPPKPMPRYSALRAQYRRLYDRTATTASEPSATSQSSGDSNSPRFVSSSSLEEYLADPEEFYGGSTTVHEEYTSTDYPAAAHMGWENHVSDLLSEVRYPTNTPYTASGSSSGESSEAASTLDSDNKPRRRSRLLLGTIETTTGDQSLTPLLSRDSSSPTDSIPQTDGSGDGARVKAQEVRESDSSSDDFYSLADDPPVVRNSSEGEDRQTLFGLDRIDEELSEAEWEDMESDNEPPDIPDPSMAINMEDIRNARGVVYESPERDRDSIRPRWSKGKGVDRGSRRASDGTSQGLVSFPDFDSPPRN